MFVSAHTHARSRSHGPPLNHTEPVLPYPPVFNGQNRAVCLVPTLASRVCCLRISARTPFAALLWKQGRCSMLGVRNAGQEGGGRDSTLAGGRYCRSVFWFLFLFFFKKSISSNPYSNPPSRSRYSHFMDEKTIKIVSHVSEVTWVRREGARNCTPVPRNPSRCSHQLAPTGTL